LHDSPLTPPGSDHDRVAEIFSDALALPAAERQAFVERACGGDAGLRAQIEKLLAVHPAAHRLFRTPLVQGSMAPDMDPEIGRQIGPYRLTAFIAAGGMGAVYLGERADREFEKRVAVKLIRSGLGTGEVLARFRNERQVLAHLEHPNIARLLDGGSTSDGRPYIVMEYVDGMPIDRHCDERGLAVNERLATFLEVCDAVQDAHRHLVIHRDLKPGNVLVDSAGRVKLLDFGIAKITEPGAADAREAAVPAPSDPTLTSFRALTPSYASPEQLRGESMTTSADVYSLGVLLYKLLAGMLPHRLDGRSAAEAERIVSEETPPRPSRAVAAAPAGEQADIATRRRTTPDRLVHLLSGDLDTIVLKALSKDPARRYTSVGDLAADIRRYRAGQPVLARPDTAAYRIAKFVRRHTAAVAGAAAFVLLLLAFALTATLQSRRVAAERDRANEAVARAAAVNAFLEGMLASVDPTRANSQGRDVTMREALDEAAKELDSGSLAAEPEVEAAIRSTLGVSYQGLGLYAAAAPHLERALAIRRQAHGEGHPDVAASLADLARLEYVQGDYAGAEAMYREALAIRRRSLGGDHPLVAGTLGDLGVLLWEQGDLAGAEALYREALAIQHRSTGHEPSAVAANLCNLGQLLRDKDDLAGAEPLLVEALGLFRGSLGEDHPDVATVLNNLGKLRSKKGDLSGADSLYGAVLAIRRRVLGDEHPDVATAMNNLASVRRKQGDLDGAAAMYREAVAIWRRSLGDEHPNVATGLQNLGRVNADKGAYASADSLFRQSIGLRRKSLGNEHPDVAYSLYELGVLRLDAGDPASAERFLRSALAIQTKTLPARDVDTALTLAALGRCMLAFDQGRDAESLLRESVSIQMEKQPDHWRRYEAVSLLGAALAAEGRPAGVAAAESLLVAGYEGLAAHQAAPRLRIAQARDRVAAAYRAWGKPDLAAAWIAKR
jgi:serine/threonine-protein kinase